MRKKGTIGYLQWNIVYITVVILGVVGAGAIIGDYRNDAVLGEDFYSKEIAKIVNLAEPGTEIVLDVTEATNIAKKNGVISFSDIFRFDNVKKEVIVSLKPGSATSFGFFNNVTVFEPRINLAQGDELETNLLIFQIR